MEKILSIPTPWLGYQLYPIGGVEIALIGFAAFIALWCVISSTMDGFWRSSFLLYISLTSIFMSIAFLASSMAVTNAINSGCWKMECSEGMINIILRAYNWCLPIAITTTILMLLTGIWRLANRRT